MACPTCKPIDCPDNDGLGAYSLQSGRFFTSPNYLFVLDCPPGYDCASGYYPNDIIENGGTIVIPDDSISDDGTTLTSDFSASLSCCDSVIPISFLAGMSMAAVEEGILNAFEQCAAAKAACDNLGSPATGVHSPIPISKNISVTLDKPFCCNTVAYLGTITATGGTGPFTWGIISGALPTGVGFSYPTSATNINVSRKARISGTPVGVGTNTFTVQVQDSTGAIFKKTLTFGVIGFTNSPDPSTVGTPYSFQFTASGGTAPYTFSVPPGHLPDGLSMDSTGLITGTPTETIPTTFTVTLTDSKGTICTKQFTMTPNPAGPPARLRIKTYVDGLLPVGGSTVVADPAWDGTMPIYAFGAWQADFSTPTSVPNNCFPGRGLLVIATVIFTGAGPGQMWACQFGVDDPSTGCTSVWSGNGGADDPLDPTGTYIAVAPSSLPSVIIEAY